MELFFYPFSVSEPDSFGIGGSRKYGATCEPDELLLVLVRLTWCSNGTSNVFFLFGGSCEDGPGIASIPRPARAPAPDKLLLV
jgi:hypothetical protein